MQRSGEVKGKVIGARSMLIIIENSYEEEHSGAGAKVQLL